MAKNNQVILTGNLGKDPEIHKTAAGEEYAIFSLSTTDSYYDERTKEWKDKDSVWHSVFAFGREVRGYARTFKKGNRVKVTGSLSYRTTEAMIEGEKRYFSSAAIIATRIEDARLPIKKSRPQPQPAPANASASF
jgi:single-strand DNA-binding protein